MTFQYMWHDHKSLADQKPTINGLQELVQIFSAKMISSVPSVKKDNRLYFVHTGDLQTWETFAERTDNVNVHVVFISTSPNTLNSTKKHVFCIKQPIPNVVKSLNADSSKVDKFKMSCNDGKPDWTIFESLIWPENLVAYYLSLIAEIPTDGLPEGLANKAGVEYDNLNKLHNHISPFNRHGIKSLFVEMAKNI